MSGHEKHTMNHMVVIETQKVKSYVFASPFLRETRGASAILDKLNRVVTEKILEDNKNHLKKDDYEIVYLGGGSGRVLFADEKKAAWFAKELEKHYAEKTAIARISSPVVTRKENESFSEWMRRGVIKSQQNKTGRKIHLPIVAGRWMRPCTSCGTFPAEKMISEFGKHFLCKSCHLKREEINIFLYNNTKPGERPIPEPLKDRETLRKNYSDKFIFYTLSEKYADLKGEDKNIFLPQTFEDIGDASVPKNYMGFIYADGNDMGATIKKITRDLGKKNDEKAKAAYTSFSEIVDQATREAAVEAVLENVGMKVMSNQKGHFIPAEFIMAGGDDLMLAVPAHCALDVAMSFIKKFQENTRSLIKEKGIENNFPKNRKYMTTSAGVVISHTHYPASDLMEMAGELMKMAKKKAAEKTGDDIEGTFDFMLLSESGSEPPKQRREKEYESNTHLGKKTRLTERPYTVSEGEKLLETIKYFKRERIPRSKLKALYPVLFQNFLQAQFDGLRIKERLKIKKTDVLEKNNLMEELNVFPFRERDGEWSTPLTEIIELYDFITI